MQYLAVLHLLALSLPAEELLTPCQQSTLVAFLLTEHSLQHWNEQRIQVSLSISIFLSFSLSIFLSVFIFLSISNSLSISYSLLLYLILYFYLSRYMFLSHFVSLFLYVFSYSFFLSAALALFSLSLFLWLCLPLSYSLPLPLPISISLFFLPRVFFSQMEFNFENILQSIPKCLFISFVSFVVLLCRDVGIEIFRS